jgi:hypothetical protein
VRSRHVSAGKLICNFICSANPYTQVQLQMSTTRVRAAPPLDRHTTSPSLRSFTACRFGSNQVEYYLIERGRLRCRSAPVHRPSRTPS